jgi:hypothetical protein
MPTYPNARRPHPNRRRLNRAEKRYYIPNAVASHAIAGSQLNLTFASEMRLNGSPVTNLRLERAGTFYTPTSTFNDTNPLVIRLSFPTTPLAGDVLHVTGDTRGFTTIMAVGTRTI